MTALPLDLFPETTPQGPPLKIELGRLDNPEVVIELRGKAEPLSGRKGPMKKRLPNGEVIQFVGLYKPDHVRKFQGDLRHAAQRAMETVTDDGEVIERPPFDDQVEVLITVQLEVPVSFSKIKRQRALEGWLRPSVKPDWDNFAKAACDACKAVVWTDDKLIVEAHVRKIYALTPLLRIEVRRLPTNR